MNEDTDNKTIPLRRPSQNLTPTHGALALKPEPKED
jgi:hypothetical protein